MEYNQPISIHFKQIHFFQTKMKRLTGKVVIADPSHAEAIENLRRQSYQHSDSMKVSDQDSFNLYCKWSLKDDNGLVLIALTEDSQVICSLRGNIYYNQIELESNNINYKGNSADFVDYPVLDVTSAATSPEFFANKLTAILTYYIFFLHKHSVKSINGSAVKNSSVYKFMDWIGFEFREVDIHRPDFSTDGIWTIGNLKLNKLKDALNYMHEKYRKDIHNFPFIIA